MDYILSLSYGKDSLACLRAIELLKWPLTRVVTSDVWATETIPADLPPMVEFKNYADSVIKERWGLEVEHTRGSLTYEQAFYRVLAGENRPGEIYGWPFPKGPWCNSNVKMPPLDKIGKGNIVYLGIAADETDRIKKHQNRTGILLPLVEIGWEEEYCGLWAKYANLLSPIYTESMRGGCWFCHNQSVQQLRSLRKNYPDYWTLMLKWDKDSPVSFRPDKHTVHDFERRFQLEDEGFLFPEDRNFRWDMLDQELNFRLF